MSSAGQRRQGHAGSGAKRDVLTDNAHYKQREYWDGRFATEESYEWLARYADLRKQLRPFLRADSRIAVVGCGNSALCADLYEDGFRTVTGVDFSGTVIDAMRRRLPHLGWILADVRDMRTVVPSASYDVVIDKATMDTLTADERSPWQPAESAVHDAHRMCVEVQRVLASGGAFIQISLQPAFFRKRYLSGEHARESYPWRLVAQELVPVGLGYSLLVYTTAP